MTIDQRDDGRILYRCRHRGQGCRIPRRPTATLLDAALLGLQLIGHDMALQGAIRDELGRDRDTSRPAGTRSAQAIRSATDALLDRRRKLLKLHYDDKISAELFGEEERELTLLIDQTRNESDATRAEDTAAQHMVGEFERVSQLLQAMDMRALWAHATETEQRQLLDELVDCVIVQPDHLQVKLHGAPTLNIALAEVGHKGENAGVEGGT